MTELHSYSDRQRMSGGTRFETNIGTNVAAVDNRSRERSREGLSDFVDALGAAVQANPWSAALIGMGVLWLFSGGSNTSLFGNGTRKSLLGPASRGLRNIGTTASDSGVRAVSSMAGSVRDAAYGASEAAAQLAGAVTESSSRVASSAGDALSTAFDTSKAAASTAASRAADMSVSGTAMLRDSTTQWVGTMRSGLADMLEQQPLWLGAIGVVVGAGIAAAVPPTDFEIKVATEAGEAVKDKLAQAASQAKDVANALAQEAEAQGLAPSGAARAVRNATETVTQKTKELITGGGSSAGTQPTGRMR